jgi:hypothetical protein
MFYIMPFTSERSLTNTAMFAGSAVKKMNGGVKFAPIAVFQFRAD